MAEQAKSRRVNLPFMARYKGRQFQVTLRAVKQGTGLVSSQTPLDIGGKLILQPSHSGRNQRILQLFVTVAREYTEQHAYALRWDKLVSPTGTTSLVEFLQGTLGVMLAPGTAMAEQLVEGEMVYYDFAGQELHVPNRGAVVGRNAPSDQGIIPGSYRAPTGTGPVTGPVTRPVRSPTPDPTRTGPIDLDGQRTGPIDRDGQRTGPIDLGDQRTGPIGGGRTGPIDLPGRRTGPINGEGQRNRPGDRRTPTPAPRPPREESPNGSFVKEGEDVVELMGMKISREDWDRLENLQYSGSRPRDAEVRRGQKRRDQAGSGQRRPTPAARDGRAEEEGKPADTGRRKVGSFLRKLADKLTDDD